ncbi:tripartite tricarboxylate transporter substrate binding protein [soil metagenome]
MFRMAKQWRAALRFSILAGGLSLSAAAMASSVELVLPIAPGGAMDVAGRSVALELSKRLEEPVIPLNKPGAGTILGTRYVAENGSSDGRTLLLGGIGMTTTQFGQQGPQYDPKQLAPVMYMGWQVTVLYIRGDIPVNTFAEFIAWAKKLDRPVTFASSGIGSSPHLGAEQLASLTGIQILHIPMTGSNASVPALLGGHVDAVFDAPSTRDLVRTGKLKALMVGSASPLPDWPELPTSEAVGLKGFKSGTWYGFFVPAKTPAAAIVKMNADLNAVLKTASVQDRFRQVGIEIGGGSPQEFAQILNSEYDRVGTIIKTRNIVIN